MSLVCDLLHRVVEKHVVKKRESKIIVESERQLHSKKEKNREWARINANKTEEFVSIGVDSWLAFRRSCRSEIDHERNEMDERTPAKPLPRFT